MSKKGLEVIGINYDQYISQLMDDDSSSETEEFETDCEEIDLGEGYELILKRIRKIVSTIRNSHKKRAAFVQTIASAKVYDPKVSAPNTVLQTSASATSPMIDDQ